MSSGRKSIGPYYAKPARKTILTCTIFRSARFRGRSSSARTDMILSCAISWQLRQRLPAAELAARRCTTRGSATRTLVLVTEDEPSFFQVIWRHLDRHPITRQRLDPVLLHLAGGVGDDLVSGIELHAITCIGEDFGDQSFELDQLFFSHGYLQIDRRSALRPLGAVGSGIRTAFAMQKSDPLHRFSLAAALRRTYRLLPVDLVPVGLRNATITTRTVGTARPFRSGRGFMAPGGVHTRSGPRTSVLRRRRRGVAMARRAAVFFGQGDADQLFDIAQKGHFLSRAKRDRDALRAGARGAADAMDIGLGNVGEIEVHHMTDAVDVDAAGGNVGGDQGADLAGAECPLHPLAMILRLVAVNGVGGDAGPCEALHDLVRAMLGSGKDQRATNLLLLQQLRQQGGLGRVVDLNDALGDALDGRGDRRHCHAR